MMPLQRLLREVSDDSCMNNTARRVVVTGMGVVSPAGQDVSTFWENIREGRCCISTLPEPIEGLNVHVAGQVSYFLPANHGLTTAEIRRNDRFGQFALAASIQAMAESGLKEGENIEPERLGVYIGSGIGGFETFLKQSKVLLKEGPERVSPLFVPMLIPNIAGGNVAIRFGAQGPCLAHISACATSTNSIGEAYLAIKYGRADAIITGGSEAPLNPLGIAGFANCKALTSAENPEEACLPFDRRRGGFVMAEGGAVVVLEELERAQRRGARILAEVCGYGCTCDANHYTAPRADGVPAAKAIKEALEEAGYHSGEALYINAHGTGTHLNDLAETRAIKLALGLEDAFKASISSTKSVTGHLFGGTGAAEFIASVLALREGIVPPTHGLAEPDPECDLDYTPCHPIRRELDIAISNSLGFGGHNVCIALRPYLKPTHYA